MAGEWPFSRLSGVIGTPTLRPDGTVLASEGYESATGLVLLAPPPMPAIPWAPSKSQASEALASLRDLLAEFPFVDDASRSVALSMLMTPVLRGGLFPAVPLHAGTGPASGTSKRHLQDLASAIATGERCAVVSVAPKPEETEKRLIGAALAGYPIIALDNCNAELAGDFLCQASERPVLQLRPLGTSGIVRLSRMATDRLTVRAVAALKPRAKAYLVPDAACRPLPRRRGVPTASTRRAPAAVFVVFAAPARDRSVSRPYGRVSSQTAEPGHPVGRRPRPSICLLWPRTTRPARG
jgi:hypothetical protein